MLSRSTRQSIAQLTAENCCNSAKGSQRATGLVHCDFPEWMASALLQHFIARRQIDIGRLGCRVYLLALKTEQAVDLGCAW